MNLWDNIASLPIELALQMTPKPIKTAQPNHTISKGRYAYSRFFRNEVSTV